MTATLRIEALNAAHDRKDFSCGVEALDYYFRAQAGQDIKRRISNCFVASDGKGRVVGYYSFAATSLPLAELTDEEKRRLPRYALLPAGLIGRLAIDQRFQGQRLGGALILNAAARAARAEPAIFALVVDAKDEKAMGFYEHLGFRRFISRPATLFLPLTTALRAMANAPP